MYAEELNPFPVEPIPTLIFSIKTLSPTSTGNSSAVLNPTAKVTVTWFDVVLNPIVLIPTPFVLDVGMIVGRVLLIPLVFLRMVTWSSPREYSRSTSLICSFVFPSNTTSFGAVEYPLPPEDIPIDSKDFRDCILITFGSVIEGLSDLSEGKSKPIFLILVLLILPIKLLCASKIDPFPSLDVTVVTPGRESYDLPEFITSILLIGPLVWVQVVS